MYYYNTVQFLTYVHALSNRSFLLTLILHTIPTTTTTTTATHTQHRLRYRITELPRTKYTTESPSASDIQKFPFKFFVQPDTTRKILL